MLSSFEFFVKFLLVPKKGFWGKYIKVRPNIRSLCVYITLISVWSPTAQVVVSFLFVLLFSCVNVFNSVLG